MENKKRRYSDDGKRARYYRVYCRYNEIRKLSISALKSVGIEGSISGTNIYEMLRKEFDYKTANTTMRIVSYMTKVEKRGELDEFKKLID